MTAEPHPVLDDPRVVTPGESHRGRAGVLLAAAVAGMVATSLQLLDRIALAERPDASLVCDINATLSCGSVLSAWQSSALGVPNAMIGLAVFSVFASAGLALVLGSRASRAFLAVLELVALFMLGFTLWFLWQSTFVIGALCLYCTVVGTAVVVVNAVVLREWRAAGALDGRSRVARSVRGFPDSGDDVWVWLALWAGVGITMLVTFAV